MQIFSLLARRKHNNELFFCTPNLVRKTNKSKLQLLKIIYSASVNVSVLSDKGLLYSSLQYQHIRVASFSREIPCQTSQAFDLNLALHSDTLLICFELLELMKRKEQVFFKILILQYFTVQAKGRKETWIFKHSCSFDLICQILNLYYVMR